MAHNVIYQPPKTETLRQFAREVSVRLAEQENDEHYADQDVVDGLTEYLKIMGELLAKHMNADIGQDIS